MKKLIALLIIGAVVLTPVTVYAAKKAATKQAKTKSKTKSKSVADLDCKDFSSWQMAQDTFMRNGGVGHDIYDLDRDHDGIACEDLKK